MMQLLLVSHQFHPEEKKVVAGLPLHLVRPIFLGATKYFFHGPCCVGSLAMPKMKRWCRPKLLRGSLERTRVDGVCPVEKTAAPPKVHGI